MQYRNERDFLGSVRVPKDAYYGSETQRAVNNFQVSGIRVDQRFIRAYALLKKAAAIANMRTGKLDRRVGNAIVRACSEVMAGKLSDQFVTDVFQAGAGTSTNMNVNEVIANRAIVHLGGKRGNYKLVHPNDHVNMSQSTNDTFPTVIHITAYMMIRDELIPALKKLEGALKRKSSQFSGVLKIGRTHLQDAVPVKLGEEFSGYYGAVKAVREKIGKGAGDLLEVPLGGTAIGTGTNASEQYAKYAVAEINRMTNSRFFITKNRFKSMQNRLEEVEVSSLLNEAAIAISKIANDLRLLGSGPRAGFNELRLPEAQPGSSIMPGKVNPSIAEMMDMVCFQVMGLDHAINVAAESGQLEINVFMPLMAYDLLFAISIMSKGIDAFADKCVVGIRANAKAMEDRVKSDLSLATLLNPYIGYSKAAKIARMAYMQNKTVKQVCLELGIMDEKQLDKILDPKKLA